MEQQQQKIQWKVNSNEGKYGRTQEEERLVS